MKTIYYKDDAIKLAMSAGEAWDMAFTCEWYNNYAVQASAGYFADLTDKIQTVTPDLYATMPQVVWDGTKVNGKVYAIPVKKDYAAEMYSIFAKDLFDNLGMQVPKTMTWDDIGNYLKAAKDAYSAGNSLAKSEYPAASSGQKGNGWRLHGL
jgi:putative aldouronate transport system substrate-binding protein